ncbi:MAG: outer membrane beta-barrel protein [Candidatus Margulisiibacteriota bacterium]|jgi:outer membrane protein W
MKTKLATLLAMTAMLASFCSAPAMSAERTLNMVSGIGVGYNYLFPKDSQIKDYYNGGLTLKAFMELRAESGLALSGDIGLYTEGNRSSLAPAKTELSIVPITASVAYHLFKDGAISPYFGGGIGLYYINEFDPDFNYLKTTKFGKHIFVGTDMRFSADSLLRAELRQSFVDPVNSQFYYQGNFGGLSAIVSVAIDWPILGPEVELTPEERVLARKQRLLETEIQARENHLHDLERHYQRQHEWNTNDYRLWGSPQLLQNQLTQTQEQIDADKAKAEELKKEQELKRQQYIDQKEKLRQEKKETVLNKGT